MHMALKSLKDSLLEYAVLNVEQLFTHGDMKAFTTGEKKHNDIRNLPPGLFDEILWKSDEMLWEIPEQCLIPCLINRDKVECRNVSYYTKKRYLEVEYLEKIIERGPPIISLDIKTRFGAIDDSDGMAFFDKLANSLESLKIGVFPNHKRNRKQFKNHPNTLEGRPVMRLKRLIMGTNSSFSQLNLDPLALNVLVIELVRYERELLARIEEFQNLTFLYLNVCKQNILLGVDAREKEEYQEKEEKAKKEPPGVILQTVLKLKKLKFLGLHLGYPIISFTTEDLNTMVSNLLFLEEVEFGRLTMISSEIVQPPKKLKLLSIYEFHSNGFSRRRLDVLAHNILFLECFGDRLQYAETSRSIYSKNLLGRIFSEKREKDEGVLIERLERLILKFLKDGYQDHCSVCSPLWVDILSKDVLSKLARVKFSSYESRNFIDRKHVGFLEDKFKASLRRRDSLFRQAPD